MQYVDKLRRMVQTAIDVIHVLLFLLKGNALAWPGPLTSEEVCIHMHVTSMVSLLVLS